MVWTQKKLKSNRRPLSQLNDLYQDAIFRDAANSEKQSVEVNDGTADREVTVNSSGSNSTANYSTVNDQTLARCVNGKFDGELVNIFDTVEDQMLNAILTAIDFIITSSPKD